MGGRSWEEKKVGVDEEEEQQNHHLQHMLFWEWRLQPIHD